MIDLTNAVWRKSSRTNSAGGACVEVAGIDNAVWRKSTRSNGAGGNCVEVAQLERAVAVRDSKDRGGPVLAVTPRAWTAFVAELQAGALDR